MKTLANCNNIEFLQQTYKISTAVKEYLEETKILEVRNNIPEAVKKLASEEKKEAMKKVAADNIFEMVRIALEENAEKTLEILGLICFTDDKESVKADRKIMTEAVSALCDENVLDFFLSLMQSVIKISKIM